MKRLRLVKIVVVPTFVIDDGDSLQETTVEPITVDAAHWPDFASGAFETERQRVENQLNADQRTT